MKHLTHSFSDHCPLFFNTEVNLTPRQKKSFRFEAWWVKEDTYEGEIRHLWEECGGDVFDKLKHTSFRLLKWSLTVRKFCEGRKTKLMMRLEEMLAQERFEAACQEINETKLQLNLEIEKDEMYWEQRARTNWLKMGDKSTAFLQKQAS